MAEIVQLLTSALAVVGTLAGATIPQIINRKTDAEKHHRDNLQKMNDSVALAAEELIEIAVKWQQVVSFFAIREDIKSGDAPELHGVLANVLSRDSSLDEYLEAFAEDSMKIGRLLAKLAMYGSPEIYRAGNRLEESTTSIISAGQLGVGGVDEVLSVHDEEIVNFLDVMHSHINSKIA